MGSAVCVKKNDTDIQNLFPKFICGAACAANWKVSSEEAEGFFRRALDLYTHKFPKRSAASLTDLSELCLCLPELCLCLPELCLCLPSCVCNGKAEQQRKGFRKCASFLKTRTVRSYKFHEYTDIPGLQFLAGRKLMT